MTDREMIEQMAEVIFKSARICDCRLCQDCEYHKKGKIGKTSCQTIAIATELIKHYQPKFSEGAVVLTKEEYEQLAIEYKRWGKLAIREIFKFIVADWSWEEGNLISDLRDFIEKQYGVDLEE